MNYLSRPHVSAKHMFISSIPLDVENRRAIVPEHQGCVITLTTVQDVAKVVAEAIEYEGEWPKRGGIQGSSIKLSALMELLESIRGTFKVQPAFCFHWYH